MDSSVSYSSRMALQPQCPRRSTRPRREPKELTTSSWSFAERIGRMAISHGKQLIPRMDQLLAIIGERISASSNHKQWEVIQKEDIDIIQGMQTGRNSPIYNGGNFSPVMDNPTHHFHKWVAQNII